jgi:hypothetical protein
VLGDATHQHHVRHRFENAQPVDPACNADRQAFPIELVDLCHQPNLATVMGLGFDKIVGPDMVASLRSQSDARSVIEP